MITPASSSSTLLDAAFPKESAFELSRRFLTGRGLARSDAVHAGDDPDARGRNAPLLHALLVRPTRPSRWGLSARATLVFRVFASATLVAIAFALLGRRIGVPAGWVQLFDDVHWTLADVGAAWLAWIGVRNAAAEGAQAERATRRWFAIGFTSYAVGQGLWDLQGALSWHPFPAPSDLFYLMLAPCCAIGMMGFLRDRVSATNRFAATLDTLSLAIAVVALALVAYLPESGTTSWVALAVMIAYPTLLLSAGCIGLMLIALLRVGRTWSAWALTAMLVAQGALWMEWNALTLQGALADGGLVNSTFSVCTLVGGLAVSAWRIDRIAGPRVARFHDGALRLLPLAVVVSVGAAVLLQASMTQLSSTARLACDAAAVLVVLLAAVRQTLQLRDLDKSIRTHHRLQDREGELHELNQHLEQCVSERTQEADERNAELSTALQQLAKAQHELVRAEKLAGLGSLVTGVAIEMTAALANAAMVVATLPAQVSALARTGLGPGDEPSRTPGDERRRGQIASHVSTIGESQRQLVDSIDQAQRVIAGFRRIAADQTSDQRRRFDLLETVREVVDITRLAHRHDPVEIIVTGEPELMLDSFPGPIGQVLSQLIDNAVVHGFDRGEGTIAVRVSPSGRDATRITVHDDGRGLSDVELAQVFAPVVTTRLAARGSGLGLGMTVCRDMVATALGGRMSIVSPLGQGTTVTLTLPRVAPG